ncbi:MAG: hypothetical protein Q9226_005164 [Calogaya cf. arnoldii]
MPNQLDQLKKTGTTVVCDSGDFATIDKYKPQDATTNPSLILAASKKEEYAKLMDIAIEYGKEHGNNIEEKVDSTLDRLLVEFGKEILQIVPGKVSTEVDARFSFDYQGSIDKALHIIDLYKSIGIDKSRVLIKLASTWEGIKAAHTLQTEHGVNCNLTLMFSLPQAIAAAEAGAYLISPFVGRILDWYKASTKKDYSPQDDPGVKSVQAIFNYYKKYGHKTIVMGASFRNKGEITELAGCDYLTISPNLLEELYNSTDDLPQKLIASDAEKLEIPKKSYINDEGLFRFDFNEEAMAVEKLREGISKFAADAITLKDILRKKIDGINLAFARLLLRNQCNVVVADLALRPEAEEVVAAHSSPSRSPARAVFQKTDVREWSQLERVFYAAIKEFGGADIPFSSFWHPPGSSASRDLPSSNRYALLDINLTHPIRATQLAIAHFLSKRVRSSSPPSPSMNHVVHISSIAGQVTPLLAPLYNASKHAISGFVRTLAPLDRHHGIRVTAVAPGVIDTPLWRDNPEKLRLVDEAGGDQWVSAHEVAEVMGALVGVGGKDEIEVVKAVSNGDGPERKGMVRIEGGLILEIGKGRVRKVEQFSDEGPKGAGNSVGNMPLVDGEILEMLGSGKWGVQTN